jgi:CRISPR-associated protein Cmr4
MQTRILHIFTRTPLHVGAGSSVGAIDQPVIRERHTGFPIIPGSAIKGVLADTYNDAQHQRTETGRAVFGEDRAPDKEKRIVPTAGAISFGEARLLAFPLRSAKGSYALATCPLALSRYKRDAGLALDVPTVADGNCLAGSALVLNGGKVALEEYVFTSATGDAGKFPADWADKLSALLDDAVLNEAKTRFVLLSDGDFSHFAVNACQVQHHNRIDDETGTVADGALFNTETVPSETLFYAPLTVIREKEAVAGLLQKFADETLLQFGGDATTGLGFCTVKLA